MSNTDFDETASIMLSLPVEMLEYIISFLPARAKVKLRYVSRRLRVVSETPSLWSEFVWPFYDKREECSVMNAFKVCGDYIKRLVFPDGVPRIWGLIEMLSYCNNITTLSLPSEIINDGMEHIFYAETYINMLGTTVQRLEHLKKLEVHLMTRNCIYPLLQMGCRLKELIVHVEKVNYSWVEKWLAVDCVPINLTFVVKCFPIIFSDEESRYLLEILLRNRLSISQQSNFRILYNFKVPLGLFPTLPDFQFELGQQSDLPYVRASTFGIFGMDADFLVLTNSTHNHGKVLYKVSSNYSVFWSHNKLLNSNVSTLDFVNEIDFGNVKSESLHSGNLEQLAIACPYLQRINLTNNQKCFSSLQGLQAMAQHCTKLFGLNLKFIAVAQMENQVQFWKILSDMKLTHLVVEGCVIQPLIGNEEKLVKLFKKFYSLRGLQIEVNHHAFHCKKCVEYRSQWSLLAHFPALRYCRLDGIHNSGAVEDILTNCKQLTCLHCAVYRVVSLPFICHSNLQQLCLLSIETDLPDIFMETISAHGELVYVVMLVNSITIKGITSLVANSRGLLKLIIITKQSMYYEHGSIIISDFIKSTLRKKFPGRKLFHAGDFNLMECYQGYVDSVVLDEYLYGTDLGTLWL